MSATFPFVTELFTDELSDRWELERLARERDLARKRRETPGHVERGAYAVGEPCGASILDDREDRAERVATSPIRGQDWRGVWIETRWQKAHELAEMRLLADALHGAGLAGKVKRVDYDSKAGSPLVTLEQCDLEERERVEAVVRAWVEGPDGPGHADVTGEVWSEVLDDATLDQEWEP